MKPLKVGLIGCGGRGTGAATQVLLSTNTPVTLWAMADAFADRLEASEGLPPSPIGPGEVQTHDLIPRCQEGLLDASAMNSNTSSAGASTSTSGPEPEVPPPPAPRA